MFLILIAVALFAALSYAVTGSSRSGDSGLSKDKMSLIINNIQQYGAGMEQAFNRLTLINGCNVSQISGEGSPFDGSDANYVNANAPSDKRCHLFHANGAGMPRWQKETYDGYVTSVSLDSAFPVAEIGTTCSSAECSEIRLVFRLVDGSSTAAEIETAGEFCALYNEVNNSTASLSDNIQDDTWHFFDGTFDYRKTLGIDSGSTSLKGQRTFCTRSNATPTYSINYVVYVR